MLAFPVAELAVGPGALARQLLRQCARLQAKMQINLVTIARPLRHLQPLVAGSWQGLLFGSAAIDAAPSTSVVPAAADLSTFAFHPR